MIWISQWSNKEVEKTLYEAQRFDFWSPFHGDGFVGVAISVK